MRGLLARAPSHDVRRTQGHCWGEAQSTQSQMQTGMVELDFFVVFSFFNIYGLIQLFSDQFMLMPKWSCSLCDLNADSISNG